VSHPRTGDAIRYEWSMWTALIVGIVAGWILVAALVALVLGRAIRVAERRRPKVRRPSRAATALGRVVVLATGQIPVIGPRLVTAMTGAIPVVRPRVD
jgi:cytochrome c biogenesis protein CcdA